MFGLDQPDRRRGCGYATPRARRRLRPARLPAAPDAPAGRYDLSYPLSFPLSALRYQWSDPPGENLTNYSDVPTVCRPIPGHRQYRWMNEVSGRGLYPGPHPYHLCNKTVYGNAAW